ncbi:ExeA family protein [Geobacter sp. DSM 9736]|uniref:ExeA family protein n=1 Tax=Geobacter sp. DSM 9736 TaxID=1277350 RepID=UPI000B60CCDC|nr:ExeA family protein [Geobacter sp. DSM 9736]SNB46101.1 general secretion pathway protein A [Geobacter sp. DSM 9736]
MYQEFYGFKEKPFTITPNPRFIFLSKHHREAFAHLLYGIDQHAGFIGLIGEVGSGKTTVLRALLNQLADDRYRTAFIFNPCLSAHELLRSINKEYGIRGEGLSIAELHEELNRFLLTENAAGRTVVLVIDEAQNLESQVLEQIRLISNLETETDKLIQIILAGQPELGSLLEQPRLRQLAQRISVRYQLLPMDQEDTGAYIAHRLEVAGGWRAAEFAPRAVKLIYNYTKGLPRLINIACDRALLIGFTEESRTITPAIAAEAIRELTRSSSGMRLPRGRKLAGLLFLLLLTGAVWYAGTRIESGKASSSEHERSPAATRDAALPASFVSAQQAKSEQSSAIAAFNVLAALWQAPPVIGFTGGIDSRTLEKLSAERGLSVLYFTGNIERLLSYDAPALLQVSVPGLKEGRFVAVAALGKGMVRLEGTGGPVTVTKEQLQNLWKGQAYLLWKNVSGVPLLPSAGTRSGGIMRLQALLRNAGAYTGPHTGVYDAPTTAAVKAFQKTQGITVDGKAGAETLLFLHRAAGYPQPRLQKGARETS